ncbi:MAG: recombination protein O N-terminal domain-containing protein [Verrucomicrobiaceae bacterium]|nr:recombination protein O N-terminal domain-containing protein [Verrucomicrobiaceae bacterium]
MQKTEAILIGRQRHTETSLIVEWCSAEMGVFKTIAKGALRPKSPFVGLLDLFVSCDLRFVPGKNTDLGILAEARWTNPRLGLRTSYGRVLAATYMVKLITLVVESHTPLAEIHALLCKALDFLTEKDPSMALITRYEQRMAEALGIVPEGSRSLAAEAIADVFHKRLPVQRRQVVEWIREKSVSH